MKIERIDLLEETNKILTNTINISYFYNNTICREDKFQNFVDELDIMKFTLDSSLFEEIIKLSKSRMKIIKVFEKAITLNEKELYKTILLFHLLEEKDKKEVKQTFDKYLSNANMFNSVVWELIEKAKEKHESNREYAVQCETRRRENDRIRKEKEAQMKEERKRKAEERKAKKEQNQKEHQERIKKAKEDKDRRIFENAVSGNNSKIFTNKNGIPKVVTTKKKFIKK